MSTRGLISIKYKGILKAKYNHFDSYPSFLGFNLVKELKGKSNILFLKKNFKNLNFKSDFSFFKNKLFCEWGYIIDLDTYCLEVYKKGVLIKRYSFNNLPSFKQLRRLEN